MRKLLFVGAFSIMAPLSFLSIFLLIYLYPQLTTLDTQKASVINNLFRAFQGGTGQVKGAASVDDARGVILRKFFAKYNSPLLEHVDFIIQTADTYGIDYRLIPAISMQESTGCKFIPENSYNCWGWGIYGDKVTRFSSYKEGIETVTRGLKRNYYDQGLTEPHTIMAKYTPPALEKGGSWAKGVNYFFDEIEAGTY